MKTLEEPADFPGAHSMDSGWFAIDKTGALAFFDTGETGAIPRSAEHLAGENAQGPDVDGVLWLQHIAPWIARNVPLTHKLAAVTGSMFLLFESSEDASNAAHEFSRHKATVCSANANLVYVDLGSGETRLTTTDFRLRPGFVGASPTTYGLAGDRWAKVIPLAYYENDWKPPGEYERGSLGADVRLSDLPADLEKMNLVFAETKHLQLADHYEQDECAVWGDKDLRTGE